MALNCVKNVTSEKAGQKDKKPGLLSDNPTINIMSLQTNFE